MQDSVKYLAAGALVYALVADSGGRVANAIRRKLQPDSSLPIPTPSGGWAGS